MIQNRLEKLFELRTPMTAASAKAAPGNKRAGRRHKGGEV
jgi:hypothetical protein